MTRRTLPLFLLLITLLITLLGPAIARADKEPTSVSFRAVYFDPRDTATPAWFLVHGGARKPLELDKSRLSPLQKASVREGGLVDFYATKEPKDGDVPVVTVTLPADSLANLLVVFVPGAKGCRGWVIHLPPHDFNPGDTLLINAATTEVAVKEGAVNPLVVNPGTSRILTLPAGFKEPMLPIQIFERREKSAPWQISQSTRWAVDLRFRSYLFFYHLPGNDRLRLHGITERMD